MLWGRWVVAANVDRPKHPSLRIACPGAAWRASNRNPVGGLGMLFLSHASDMQLVASTFVRPTGMAKSGTSAQIQCK